MFSDRGPVVPALPARARKGALAPSRCGSTLNMASNIKVAVRVRPLNHREHGENSRVVVDVVDEKMLVFDPKEEMRPFFYQGVQQPYKNFMKRANKELKFVFDHVCGQDASNKDVFETTTKDMLASLMEGYNCSVFVYGATGAGKTFTMIGNIEHPGITYLTMEHLFYTINSYEQEREFDIGVSYIEVYNENVYDLLKPSNTPLQLREDNHYGVMVAGLSLHNIKTARELLQMLESGNKMRTQHPTDANAESSRSHAVFQVYIKMRYKTSSQLRLVKLSMIDLAGSERASATGCVGDRFKEGANINKSLLSLGNCINKLADGGSYIPYRDSKLTRLLKDSLGGNCKTVMIANVSPSSLSFEDTYNTLKYAARANKIQLSIKKNIVDGDVRLSQYVKITEELKKKVKELEVKLSLSSLKVERSVWEPNMANEKVKQDWRRRLLTAEEEHIAIESKLLSLMCNARVLAMQRRRNAHGIARVLDMALRSSTEALVQTNTEEELTDEQVAKDYMKQAVTLDTKIAAIWPEWDESRSRLNDMCESAVAQCPDLTDLVHHMRTRSDLRQTRASNDTRYKIGHIQIEEITKYTGFVSDMTDLLKKLFLTLKGYNHLSPADLAEYLELQKRAKSSRHITWFDQKAQLDAPFKFMYNMNIEQPLTSVELTSTNGDAMVDMATDSEDLTDAENKDPVRVAKRKGTPIRLANNETIIIDDSFENLDTTRNLNSAKKVRQDLELTSNVENYGLLDPKDLNSTFVLAGKMNSLKKTVKSEKEEPKRGLTDRTNMPQRTVVFNSDRAKAMKPLVGRALPCRRPASAPAPGFGSSLARDGTPLVRNTHVGFKAMRSRGRVQNHPYPRPPRAPSAPPPRR